MLAQAALFAFAPETSVGVAVWSLCGLPAMAFFAGYLTITLAGQPRVGGRYPANARLGGLICFIGMPLGWVLLIAASQFHTRMSTLLARSIAGRGRPA
ncbi:hypothetical protein [Phytohabitans rumicis]|uniref:Uncharacterized protein n=1 Tax=Phytohabitans rumicis TaxID=1076125 RepID=A0A6V8KXY4_9ACTN|nr:hypothetical protein [Phytohabitans rumicis]GFJ89962.1 hypothetical protein Prum_036040 [Phytohabitans rumicis]